MNLPWHAMDDEIVGQWSQLNSLSELLRLERRLGVNC
jgi:hypothetical protein